MKQLFYVHSCKWEWEDYPHFSLNRYSMTDADDYTFLGTIEIEIPFAHPSRADQIAKEVAKYRRMQGTLQAQITEIDGKINELLCIEHNPEVRDNER